MYETLAIEERFEIDIMGNAFVGVVDLVLRDKVNGDIIVYDHKSKSMQSLKKDIDGCKRQLYVYAAFIKEKYGVYPKLLRFNMFRYNEFVDEQFSMEKYEATLKWVADTIARIKKETEWPVSSSGYFCKFICSVRDHCPIGNEIIHAGGRHSPT